MFRLLARASVALLLVLAVTSVVSAPARAAALPPVSAVVSSTGVGTVSLSWSNPQSSDFRGVRVCRSEDDTVPDPATCAPSRTIPSPGNTFYDTGRPAGATRFWLWAYGVGGTFSAPTPVGVTIKGNGVPGAVRPASATNVTADVLPTTQINGIAWTQVVVGSRVYVGGRFSYARPARARPGVAQVARGNLLAYDLNNGRLISTFAPATNGPVYSMAVTPDRTRLYIGGNFTTVNGARHPYVAAIAIPSGEVISGFAPEFNSRVRTVTASNSGVYAGGDFTAVGTAVRQHLAAINAAGGTTAWTPYTDDSVRSLLLTPDGTKVVIGGGFTYLNGAVVRGLGAVTTVSPGARQVWRTSEVVNSYGHNSDPNSGGAVLSLKTDGATIFGSVYNTKNAPGVFEGAFAASAYDGTVKWVENCHGDVYDTFPTRGAVYLVGHPHWCANDNGWTNPARLELKTRRVMAFTKTATGSMTGATEPGYPARTGLPAPSIIDWFPKLAYGSISGQSQAAWAIGGYGAYVAVAGEFPTVNGVRQQGLARFATRPTAPAKVAPTASTVPFVPVAVNAPTGGVQVTVPAAWDMDSMSLTYRLVRDGDTAHPVSAVAKQSTFWLLPSVVLTDPAAGTGPHTYTVVATDSDGNTLTSAPASITLP